MVAKIGIDLGSANTLIYAPSVNIKSRFHINLGIIRNIYNCVTVCFDCF